MSELMSEQSSAPLHTHDPLNRFSVRAGDYARYRPTYPTEAIALILTNLGDPDNLAVADIGAGTGISARLLADRGVRVTAVEPNAAMRAAAEPHPRVTYRDGTAEQTGFPTSSLDLVTCCQAFHWFDPAIALPEFHRILKPGGRLALMWNDRDAEDPLVAAMDAAIRQAGDGAMLDRGDRKSAQALAESSLFINFRSHLLHWRRPMDLAALQGLVMSASYSPQPNTPAAAQLLVDLEALFDRWATPVDDTAQINLAYRLLLYLAEAS